MGQWVHTYSDAIYGTRGGPYKPGKWGASTCKENTVFLFIMKWPQEGSLKMPALPAKVTIRPALMSIVCQMEEKHYLAHSVAISKRKKLLWNLD